MGYTKKIKFNPDMDGLAEIIPDVVFSHTNGEELKMQIIAPWNRQTGGQQEYPLVVFIQGSGWTFPNVWYELPQLCELARRGYVVASVTHRNSIEGYPFPACLQDIKTAVRYLRKNAAEYCIDTERVGIWGTSSGGNLAMLTVMTAGEAKYETEEYAEYSDDVKLCVSCFPPSDLAESMSDDTFDAGIKQTFAALSGGMVDKDMSVLKEMSPYHIAAGRTTGDTKKYPPMFIAHGDADGLIPYSQSEKLYRELCRLGEDVTFVTVENAPHEGSFWSREILEMIFEFIQKNI